MNDRLPSLDLLLELVQRERDKQLAHLDALDNKAGIVLGFAGLLITLAPDVPVGFQLVGCLLAPRASGAPSRRSGLDGFPCWSRPHSAATCEQRSPSRG